jgi:hypothetical protein
MNIYLGFFSGECLMLVAARNKKEGDFDLYLRPINKLNSYLKEPIQLGKMEFRIIKGEADVNLLEDWSQNRDFKAYYSFRNLKNKEIEHTFRVYNELDSTWTIDNYTIPGLKKFLPYFMTVGEDGHTQC